MQSAETAKSTTPAQLIELLGQVAERDRAAFQTLYQATALKLFGIIHRILRRRDAAEDVLQEVYVKIWERAGDYHSGRGAAITWMATIARNRALDVLRQSKATVSFEDLPDFDANAADTPHPLARREQQEEARKLLGCLGQLEPEKKMMILLAYTQGMSRDALAERFSKPVATVKTWLRRSLEAVKGCLGS